MVFDNRIRVIITDVHKKQRPEVCMVKLLRVDGGCLGAERR